MCGGCALEESFRFELELPATGSWVRDSELGSTLLAK